MKIHEWLCSGGGAPVPRATGPEPPLMAIAKTGTPVTSRAIAGWLVRRGLAGAGVALERDRERSVRVDCGVRHDRHAADRAA